MTVKVQGGAFLPLTGGTLTGPIQLGGTVSGAGNQINNVIIGAATPLAGSFTSGSFSGNVTIGTGQYFYATGGTGTVSAGIQFDGSGNSVNFYTANAYRGGVNAAGTLVTMASATGGAGLNAPHGAAPASPGNGDIWTTTAGLFVRINGVTKSVNLT